MTLKFAKIRKNFLLKIITENENKEEGEEGTGHQPANIDMFDSFIYSEQI